MKRAIAALMAAVLSALVWAQTPGEVEAMRQRLAELEKRLDQMETAKAPVASTDVAALRQELKEMSKRLDSVEKSEALDRIRWSGDFRFEAHSIDSEIPAHVDGMALQNMVVNTLFYYGATGMLPSSDRTDSYA